MALSDRIIIEFQKKLTYVQVRSNIFDIEAHVNHQTMSLNSSSSIINNATSVFEQELQSNDLNSDYFPFFKLITSTIDAIWEQSEHSQLNTTAWNRFGAISKYCCSIYGLSCLIMALILNRTLVMASTNNIHNQQMAINRQRHLGGRSTLMNAYKSATVLRKLSVLSFRIGIVGMLVLQIYNVLVTLKLNQQLGIASNSDIMWFYNLIPSNLFNYTAEKFADSKYMKTPAKQVMIGPTSDMYWPIFLTFCASSFVETFVASIQGRKPFTESGITIFEHSLAFQEFSSNAAFFFSNSNNFKRPTEEVLIVSLFSILNHLNIHIGAIVNNNRYRLIPSTIIGVGFLSYFINAMAHDKFFKFPTILIMTFTPQVLIMYVIMISLTIFICAIIANGFKLQGLNYASFFLHEHNSNELENEVNHEEEGDSFSNFNISLKDDFYTALLNLGVLAITSAGKSSYITELSLVTLDSDTWIERNPRQRVKSVFGYQNIIDKPGPNLITFAAPNEEDKTDFNQRDTINSVFRKRYLYMNQIVSYLLQLLYGIVGKIIKYPFTFFQKKDSQPASYEQRILKTPKFLRKYVKKNNERRKTIDINAFSDEDVELNYASILMGQDLNNNDDSNDFTVLQESEYESDSEYEVEEISVISHPTTDITRSPLYEILNDEESSNTNFEGRLTRSKYKELKCSSKNSDESSKLIELILTNRSNNYDKVKQDHSESNHLECVICQTNMREIITWPCKCFAICESCRLSLVSKGIEGCVCCRRDVQGVSKIFIP
ncbi:uncharacterized protein KGF55_003714 [Candida pseudojiufengensis]|uniref:uncharacterized protein n=1 Tax=Candida pseudojiufengensis TaxID=497109 RepID=UPI0022257A1E|nr:uncharacterized protein KGF55_003714 [Candida pseudojiufengensis]KAI5962638.1 hypothetical protein KGF55_003714 [Candida pseudojiufengensis]